MRRFSILAISVLFILASCQASSGNTPAPTGTGPSLVSRCGDGTCTGSENTASCPRDCPATTFSGRIKTTTIRSEGLDIAVMVASPLSPRYPDGAGVVVMAAPIFSEADGFVTDPDLTSLGLIQVSYLWPGGTDTRTKTKSSGEFDYGGDVSVKILRDVIRFAGARMADSSGRYIVSMTSVPPLVGEVGVYAFSDAGITAIRAMSLYGSQLQGLGWFVGREIPSVDTISCGEIGYYDDAGEPIYNPLYVYPANYTSNALVTNYDNVRWDPVHTSSNSTAVGRPYLDLDGSGSLDSGDHVFDGQIPIMFGKRYYSTALTQALLDNGMLSQLTWPADLATPQEAAQAWLTRQTPGLFVEMQDDEIARNMKVMLVFAQNEHAQVAQDKPHIHQLYQGFRFEARLWVRLNPDRAYVEFMIQNAGTSFQGTPGATPTLGANLDFPDNPANTQPTDWAQIGEYAYLDQGQAGRLVPLAAVAEMADREHDGYWDENLGQVIYTYATPTPQP